MYPLNTSMQQMAIVNNSSLTKPICFFPKKPVDFCLSLAKIQREHPRLNRRQHTIVLALVSAPLHPSANLTVNTATGRLCGKTKERTREKCTVDDPVGSLLLKSRSFELTRSPTIRHYCSRKDQSSAVSL